MRNVHNTVVAGVNSLKSKTIQKWYSSVEAALNTV